MGAIPSTAIDDDMLMKNKYRKDFPRGKRIFITNMRAQHIAYNKAITAKFSNKI